MSAPPGPTPIADSAPAIRASIGEVRHAHLPGAAGVVAIGRSIGDAVALMLGADRSWPLLAAAASGVGDWQSPASANWPPMPAGIKAALPEVVPAEVCFGPVGTFGWDAVGRLRRAGEPWVLAEIGEMVDSRPRWWRAHAAAITTPLHLRLADHEGIWTTGPEVVARMAARLTGVRRLDVALMPDGGHLYELHHRSPELVASQLDFLEAALAPA